MYNRDTVKDRREPKPEVNGRGKLKSDKYNENEVITMTDIIVERTWNVNGLTIVKTYETSCITGKKIPNSVVYSVEDEEESLDCFATLAEARAYARNYA